MTWLLWLDGAHGPSFNMAFDHVLLDRIGVIGRPLLRIYTWDRPSISFGRSQLHPEAFASSHALVRRPTGGGIVWHDGDLTYTVVLPADHALAQMEVHESYRLMHEAIGGQLGPAAHLQEERRAGVDVRRMRCFESPVRHDILGAGGAKLAGAAQLRTKAGVLVQGSVRLEATEGDWTALRDAIIRAFGTFAPDGFSEWTPDADFLRAVEEKAANQYATDAWNLRGELPAPAPAPAVASRVGEERGERLPGWIRIQSSAEGRRHVSEVLADLRLNTVCASAHCPNLGACFSGGVATFLILGRACTRDCRFCAIEHSPCPAPPEPDEAVRLAEGVHRLGLKYVVVTSVTRDDLPDGGAGAFREAILAIRRRCPGTGVEVLTPDFAGREEPLMKVLEVRPEVFNHNVETVRRLSTVIRSAATYERSMSVLRAAVRLGGGIPVKSGIMLGLGEREAEVRETLAELRDAGVSLLTLGQYLPPTKTHHPLDRHLSPEEFDAWKDYALGLGFRGVMSGPLVRSSYQAFELYKAAKA
ncbi:MAG: lipoyl synthase [Kiritimatiellia bacterium]|jgi:lipoic acid synthetase|uniref:lipoyl synthase n=1 Tax=Atribacter sp. TaxID=2847780 RepID=UPI003D9A0743